MRKIDMTDVQETTDFKRLTAGPYICKITKIENVPLDEVTNKGDYLRIWFDIDEGEFSGYYTEMRNNHPDWDWVGRYIRSYKPTALGMFKRFCSAVSKSNNGFVFDAGDINADETTLIGKRLGLILQEKEYNANDGSIKSKLEVYREFEISKLNEQKTPDPDRLPRTGANDSTNSVFVPEGVDDELPFS